MVVVATGVLTYVGGSGSSSGTSPGLTHYLFCASIAAAVGPPASNPPPPWSPARFDRRQTCPMFVEPSAVLFRRPECLNHVSTCGQSTTLETKTAWRERKYQTSALRVVPREVFCSPHALLWALCRCSGLVSSHGWAPRQTALPCSLGSFPVENDKSRPPYHPPTKTRLPGRNTMGGDLSAPWVLLEEVGMKRAEVAAIVTSYPHSLTIPAKHARPVVRWLSDRAGLSPKQVIDVNDGIVNSVNECFLAFLGGCNGCAAH